MGVLSLCKDQSACVKKAKGEEGNDQWKQIDEKFKISILLLPQIPGIDDTDHNTHKQAKNHWGEEARTFFCLIRYSQIRFDSWFKTVNLTSSKNHSK